MTDSKIENLYQKWTKAYAARLSGLDYTNKAIEAQGLVGPAASEAEKKYHKELTDPFMDAYFATEEEIFTCPSTSLHDLAIKILVAFTDNDEPDELRRDSLNADASRILGLAEGAAR